MAGVSLELDRSFSPQNSEALARSYLSDRVRSPRQGQPSTRPTKNPLTPPGYAALWQQREPPDGTWGFNRESATRTTANTYALRPSRPISSRSSAGPECLSARASPGAHRSSTTHHRPAKAGDEPHSGRFRKPTAKPISPEISEPHEPNRAEHGPAPSPDLCLRPAER